MKSHLPSNRYRHVTSGKSMSAIVSMLESHIQEGNDCTNNVYTHFRCCARFYLSGESAINHMRYKHAEYDENKCIKSFKFDSMSKKPRLVYREKATT